MPRAPSPPPPQTSPQHAGAAIAELFTVSGRNPFRVSGPAVVSFSGGRTSGMMLRKVLDAYGGTLPDDVHVVFTNTGAEDNRTLDFVDECARRWGVRVRWLEFTLDTPARYREVDYERADRAYGPFNDCIRIRSALPNGRMRFCTIVLKIEVLKAFMRAQGYADDEWTNIVGLRADEAHRLSNLRERPETTWDVVAPLIDAGVRKPDVLGWWQRQPFNLTTPETHGNCVGCFLKGKRIRDVIADTDPDALVWWEEKERETGRRFIFKEPTGYAGTLQRAHLRVIAANAPAPEYAPEDFASIPCDCTERRAPPLPCICPPTSRPRRSLGCDDTEDRGHTLLCAELRAAARVPGPEGWRVREEHERDALALRRERVWQRAGRGVWSNRDADLADAWRAEDAARWERMAPLDAHALSAGCADAE